MATDSPLRRLMAARATSVTPAPWETADDLARISLESMMSSRHGDVRDLESTGVLRLSGAGVLGSQAEIDRVGAFAVAWQRAVTSIGASLEGFRSARGRLSSEIVTRTKLLLVAPPSGGSVVLEVAPKVHGVDDGVADGLRPLFGASTPLADRAVTSLLELLANLAKAELADLDEAASRMRDLGPRVAGSVRVLAESLAEGSLDVEASWREPGEATRRASVTASQASWIRRFIDGQELDAEEDFMTARALTVSNWERWLLEVDGEVARVNASTLDLEEVRRVRPGDQIKLRVRTFVTLQPDGTHKTRHEALEVVEVTPPDGRTT